MATLRERQNTGTVRVTVLATEAGVLYVPNDTSGQLAAPAASEAGWMMRDDEVWDWNPARITSYNVCYTKLLRFVSVIVVNHLHQR